MYGIQVADGYVLERVLKSIQDGRHGQLPAVAREDGVVDLPEEDRHWGRGCEGA